MGGESNPAQGRSNRRKSRMHTVPSSYFEPFAISDPRRRTPAVLRFDRTSGEGKEVGIYDAEVVRDIYTVYGADGQPDTGIEDKILCDIEGQFCQTRDEVCELVQRGTAIGKEHWIGLVKFVALQLLRTPRSFQFMRDLLDSRGTEYDSDAPQRIMLVLTERTARRIARMRGVIANNETEYPLLTSDNPVATWRADYDGQQFGVDLRLPNVVVSCPLTPEMLFMAFQTSESLEALSMQAEMDPRKSYQVHIDMGLLPTAEVKRLNAICLGNAHRYVYANDNSVQLQRFLERKFFGLARTEPRRGF